jgi:ferredoxin-NADP reductase
MMADPTGDGWMYFSIRQHLEHPDIVPLSYLRSMMMAILAAAHETTSNASANAIRLLLSDREAWNEICANPALIPNAVEECLRRAGSIVAWRRIATAATRIGNIDIPSGAKLLIVMASANHDEHHFENPDAVDLHRDNSAEHLSFGYGAHQCMGKNIARMEMRIFLEEFAKRLPHMELVADQAFKYLPNTSFRGPNALRVRWDPSGNPERLNPSLLQTSLSFRIGAPLRTEIARQMRVAEIRREADGIRSVVLESLDRRPLPGWTPGAHVDLMAGEFDRKYSLCGDRTDRIKLRIAILRENQGRGGSKYFHENLSPGSLVRVRGPKNHFKLDESASSYTLIAGGIGITPILAMADRLKSLGKRYTLHYAGRSPSTMAFIERVKRDHGGRLHLYAKSEGQRMTLSEIAGRPGERCRVYACGPERLLAELQALAREWPPNVLQLEHFAAATAQLDPAREHAFRIELRDSNLTIEVPADRSVLDSLHAVGIDVACDCREGLCGSCEVLVLDGEVDHRDRVLSVSERATSARMMACCSRARGNKLVLAL